LPSTTLVLQGISTGPGTGRWVLTPKGKRPDMDAPLIVTDDPTIIDELQRLAAAAGVTPALAPDPEAALHAWNAAPLVFVGVDLAKALARLSPPRRSGVHLVGYGGVPDDVFRTALALGAENVAELPRSAGWVAELIADVGDATPHGSMTVGVIAGSGGAGASTFACALGQMAARSGPAVVIDADPLGPGVDRVLGLDGHDGIRWDALCQTTGRFSGRSLRESLPRRDGLGVLTWYPGPQGSLQAFAVRNAIAAAQRGHETVVVDLPRSVDPLVEELVARCDRVFVLTVPTVAGLASAVRLCARFRDPTSLRLVVRGDRVRAEAVSRLTTVPVAAQMPDQRGLEEAIDLGLGPVRSRRGPLGRTAVDVLADLEPLRRAA
jgi:secretion/DNA translocation related CpaE-like protein